jgi:hypothetical protein
LVDIFKSAFYRTHVIDDSDEFLSYRFALLGLILGTSIMVLWSVIAGMSFIVSLSVILIFYITMIAMTRMVSEGGMLFVQTPFRPLDLIIPATGSSIIGASNLTILAYQEMIFMFDVRSSYMPSFMDSLKLSENLIDRPISVQRSFLSPRFKFGSAVTISIIISMVVSYVSTILIGYKYGGANLSQWFFVGGPQLPFVRLSDMLFHPQSASITWLLFMGIGAVFMIFITLMRARFFWWPFQPIGYAMGCSWPMIQLWFSIFIGWILKFMILRYGGIKVYQRFRSFFLGMVLGEFLSGGIWLIIDFIAGKSGHRIFLF